MDNSAQFGFLTKQLNAAPVYRLLAAFAQDEWKITPDLNLSLGLRWELDPAPTDAHGDNAYTLSGSLSDPSTLALAPRGTPLWETTWYNFAPRLGAAWTVRRTRGHETVVRAGGGVFFDSDNQLASDAFSGIGFYGFRTLSPATLPITSSALDFSPSISSPYTSSVIYAFPPHLQLPYTLEWNVSVQQALGKSQALTLSYVGSNGRRLIQEHVLSLNSLNPNFGSVAYEQGGVTSNYQALQVQFQRTVSHGLQVLGAYTWSHSLDFGSTNLARSATRGNSDFDLRNNFSAGASWDIPNIANSKILGALLNRWGADAHVIARSGFPITLLGNYLIDPATGTTEYGNVNRVSSQPLYLYGSQYPGGRVLNRLAFVLPSGDESGNFPRNSARGFGAEQFNTALRREFPLYDRLTLQFRAEAFNIFNHPNFGYVDPTLTDATFGQATAMLNQSLATMSAQYQQGGPRSMQFALRFQF